MGRQKPSPGVARRLSQPPATIFPLIPGDECNRVQSVIDHTESGEPRALSDVAGTAAYRRSPSYMSDLTVSDILAFIAGALVAVVAVVLAIGHYLPRGKSKDQ